ncbi:hypothetical protein [Roseinatronobacter sp.]|uniref:hypothetical protein n=1 Tax=Roseinatronobacter sp. TaxID=1945755 RepID=UPI003F72E7BD
MLKLENLPSNSHLMIVWDKGRTIISEIEEYLKDNFKILYRNEVQWSKDLAHHNMSRFYGKKLPDIAKKVEHCGTGPFLVYLISDPTPNWILRMTTSGVQRVNRNIFEAKKSLRIRSGGGHRIHATNNLSETLRDTSLIFGSELPKTSTNEILKLDLAGARSWNSLTELFSVLNSCAPYIVLRNFETLPEKHDSETHGDIDILCNDHLEVRQLLNARPVFDQSYRRYHIIRVGDKDVPFDIRDVGENYYCKKWSSELINNRILVRNIFIPNENDYLYSLAYHALVHKRNIAPDYLNKMLAIFDGSNERDLVSSQAGFLSLKLRSYMYSKGYSFVRPLDWSVYFSYDNVPEVGFPWKCLLTSPPRTKKHLKREIKAFRNARPKYKIRNLAKRILSIK